MANLNRFTVVLLSTVVLMLAATELVTVVAFDRVSRVQRTQVGQRERLQDVRDSPAGRTAHMAVLGNSLIMDGLDVSLLATTLEPDVAPVPYFVLATLYYDWYFGLKRLYTEGMRPRYVLLGLSPNQLVSPALRGDYSARYLFQRSDLLDVAQQTRMDATRTSGFLLAHVSKYYSARSVIRGFVLGRTLPSVSRLLQSGLASREQDVPERLLREVAAERLSALDRLCRDYGSRFMLVVPPSYQGGAEIVAEAGRSRGVPVLVPWANHEVDSRYFQSDGYHLNTRGAEMFTARLATKLAEELVRD